MVLFQRKKEEEKETPAGWGTVPGDVYNDIYNIAIRMFYHPAVRFFQSYISIIKSYRLGECNTETFRHTNILYICNTTRKCL